MNNSKPYGKINDSEGLLDTEKRFCEDVEMQFGLENVRNSHLRKDHY